MWIFQRTSTRRERNVDTLRVRPVWSNILGSLAGRYIPVRSAAGLSNGVTISSIIWSSPVASHRGSIARTVHSGRSTHPTCGPTCAGSILVARSLSLMFSPGSSGTRRSLKHKDLCSMSTSCVHDVRPMSSHRFGTDVYFTKDSCLCL